MRRSSSSASASSTRKRRASERSTYIVAFVSVSFRALIPSRVAAVITRHPVAARIWRAQRLWCGNDKGVDLMERCGARLDRRLACREQDRERNPIAGDAWFTEVWAGESFSCRAHGIERIGLLPAGTVRSDSADRAPQPTRRDRAGNGSVRPRSCSCPQRPRPEGRSSA